MSFQNDKQHYMNMPLGQKRREYKCGDNYFTLNHLQTWAQYTRDHPMRPEFTVNPEINEKVCVFIGDIVAIEVDAIINAANPDLMGGGGVDEVIHRAAGKEMLQSECRTLNGCATGESKITGGYKLPAKYIIHTVGPVGEQPQQLVNSYLSSLELMRQYKLRSIAFPCISTGVYDYPNEKAAHIALRTVRLWLESDQINCANTDRIIFCLFKEKDISIYKELFPIYFPFKQSNNNHDQVNNSNNNARQTGNTGSSGNSNVDPSNIGWCSQLPDIGVSNDDPLYVRGRDLIPEPSNFNNNNARTQGQSQSIMNFNQGLALNQPAELNILGQPIQPGHLSGAVSSQPQNMFASHIVNNSQGLFKTDPVQIKKLFHYTSSALAREIKSKLKIKQADNGPFDRGVLLTELDPYTNYRNQILHNNYGGSVPNGHENRADWVVLVEPNTLTKCDLVKIDNIGTRNLWLYKNKISVLAKNVFDKPKSN